MLMSLIGLWTKPTTTSSLAVKDCWRESLCFYPQFNWLVSYEAIIGLHLLYGVVVYGLVRLMKARAKAGIPPFELKTAMLVYNFAQIVISTMMTVGLAPYVLKGLYNVGGTFEHDIEFWVLAHYAAKYLDMFDTVFIILRAKDKQFSFLHVYHHATIGVIWGGLLHWGVANGTCFFGAWINSLVHAMMYGHYFFSSLGFENPLKKYLTMFQMFQFFLCIVHAIIVVGWDTSYPRKVSSIQALYHPTLLHLFYDYLKEEEKAKKREKAKLAAAASLESSSQPRDSNNGGDVVSAASITKKASSRKSKKEE